MALDLATHHKNKKFVWLRVFLCCRVNMRWWHRGFGRNRQFIAIPLSAGRAWGWVLIQQTQQNNKHNTSWGALSQQEGCTMMSSHLCPTVWEWHRSFWTRVWSRGLRVGGANQWGLWCYPPKQKQLIWRKQTAKTNFRWWFSINSETHTLSHIHKYTLSDSCMRAEQLPLAASKTPNITDNRHP